MMKKRLDIEKSCSVCEHSEEIFGGEYCICKKKGVVLPTDACSSFFFDPLKVKVSVQRIPKFTPIPAFQIDKK